ncbi:MAG: hypothetical protein LIP08_03170 [Bacteroides sp.]|nr:hypothetical protein [Bacteroides sp.]
MKQTIFFLLLLTVFMTACQTPDRTFSKYGVSFTYPAGWQIRDNAESKTTSRIQLTRTGSDDGGITIIRIFDEEDMAETHIDLYTTGMRREGILENMRIEERIPDSYGSYSGWSISYTGTDQSKPYIGKIFILRTEERSCRIITQEALADQEENRSSRELIEKTFRIDPLPSIHQEFEKAFDTPSPEEETEA